MGDRVRRCDAGDVAPVRVRRFDAGELGAGPVRMPNGWLRCQGKIARAGIQLYDAPDGKVRRELREPAVVFDPAAMRSFVQVPLTNTHPPVMLTAENTRMFAVGSAGDTFERVDDWMVGSLMITDATAIAAVESGRVQLSAGYECTLDETPGVHPEYGPYDARQLDVKGNHIAIVDEARAGPEARLKLDSRGNAVLASTSPDTTRHQEPTHMPTTIRIDGVTFEIDGPQAAAAAQAHERHVLATAKAHADAMTAATTAATTRLDGVTKERDVLRANSRVLLERVGKVRTVWDAMKAKMIACDECGGSGQVASTDGKTDTSKCDYCGGTGSIRMHDAIKGMEMEEPEDGAGEEDMDEAVAAASMEEEELEEDAATASPAAKKADEMARRRLDAARRDAAADRKAWRKRRADSMARRFSAALRARVALETTARRYLDAADVSDDDLARMGDDEVMRKVIAKLAPTAKLDGKSTVEVRARYDAEIERAPEFTVEDAREMVTRGLPKITPAGGAPRNDGRSNDPAKAREAMIARLDAKKKPAAK